MCTKLKRRDTSKLLFKIEYIMYVTKLLLLCIFHFFWRLAFDQFRLVDNIREPIRTRIIVNAYNSLGNCKQTSLAEIGRENPRFIKKALQAH